jgi:galactokinase
VGAFGQELTVPDEAVNLRHLLCEVRNRTNCEVLMVRAPGRVNLIGEHTDYNDGWVLPIAIEYDVRMAVFPTTDRSVCLRSLNYGGSTRFNLDGFDPDEKHPWGNYVRGVADELTKCGCLLRGMEGVVEGNVPMGAGLSSSAAMEVAAALAFEAVSQQTVDPVSLVRICQAAENNYIGVRSGIMDQFASRMGHPGHAVFLDCRTLEYDLIPIPSDEHVFVVANSGQSRELAGSAYNERRAQCEAAVEVLKQSRPEIKALRDVTPEELEAARERLDPVVYRRARHVVTENARVHQAVAALREDNVQRFGELMNASHDSLRDDYEVSSAGLDALVNAARAVNGCLGSRLTGAGFGGCTVSLVRADAVEAFQEQVGERYQAETGIKADFFVTRPAAGAGLVARS